MSERKTDRQRSQKSTSLLGGIISSLDGRYQRQLLLFLLALSLTFIIIPKGGLTPGYHNPGDIAARDIKSPRELLIPDEVLTDRKRQSAEDAVGAFYDYDSEAGVTQVNRLNQLLETGFGAEQSVEAVEQVKVEADSLFGVALTPDEWRTLKKISESKEAVQALRNSLLEILSYQIVNDVKLFQADMKRGIILRDLATDKILTFEGEPSVIDLNTARKRFADALAESRVLPKQQIKTVVSLIDRTIRPNLFFNQSETAHQKKMARDTVTEVLYQVKRGEMIVREGERITDNQVLKLQAMRKIGSDSKNIQTAVGLLFCTLIILYVSDRFASRNIRKYNLNDRDLLFLSTTFVGLFVLIKLAIFVSSALESAFPYIESTSYYYVVPFAVGAMLVRIVLNSEVTVFFAFLAAILVGFLFGNNLFLTFYTFVGSLTAAHWVRHCKERATLYRASFHLSIVNVLTVISIHFLVGHGFDLQLLYKSGFGLLNGFICAVIVIGTIPLIEHLFKYTTDIKLLEMANMHSPVLRELMIQAPGTYHHSVVVGNLVEAAAEEINVNPLLCRVAAYYHDIGKLRKPLYFIENTGGGENRHDKLAPSMSALILMAHLKDGVEIARENKLGDQIINIIRQHHGTALIKFFYDKAKKQVDENVQQVSERDYRYPGPKPQTREAALIMLADAVEAASRTLSDPTPARTLGMVQKIINNIFIDGQLDECELSLKDMHMITKSFARVLGGIFHHRVDYPEPVHKERVTEKKNGNDSNRERATGPSDKNTKVKKSGADDIKRLGMS
ncbi:MAG: HDIG domain-containing protein [Desulfuromonadales bacterium]|nr:HDIG domain-containing protein [Desulfuromonadales bacterium]